MFEIKTLKDGLKKIAPRTKTKAITDDANKSLDTILSEKANSTDVPSKVSQLANDTGFITNAALDNYPNNTQMNAAINSHHDSTKQDKLAAQTPYTNVGSKSKIPKITTNALGQVTNVEEVDVEAQQANLSQNLTYANDNNTTIVTNVASDSIIDDGTATGLSMTFSKVSDGSSIDVDFPIFKFLNSDFLTGSSGIVSLNPTKLANYLLKSDAPGYADILTKTLASTTYETIANVNAALTKKLDIANVVDNLTSTDTNKALSANQGRILNEKITSETNRATNRENELSTSIASKQDKLTFKDTDFSVSNNNVALAPGVLKDSVSAEYTPAGTIQELNDYYNIVTSSSYDAGYYVRAQGTLPSFSYSISGAGDLTFNFNQGELPELSLDKVSVPTNALPITIPASKLFTFVGTKATITSK